MGRGGETKRGEEVEMRKEKEHQQTCRLKVESSNDLLQCQQHRILDMGHFQLIKTAGMDRVKLKQWSSMSDLYFNGEKTVHVYELTSEMMAGSILNCPDRRSGRASIPCCW